MGELLLIGLGVYLLQMTMPSMVAMSGSAMAAIAQMKAAEARARQYHEEVLEAQRRVMQQFTGGE